MRALLLVLVTAALAAAHSFDPMLLDLRELSEGRFAVRWKVPPALAGEGVEPVLPSACRVATPPEPASPSPGDVVAWQVECGPTGLGGTTIAVTGLASVRSDVLVRFQPRDGEARTTVLSAERDAWTVPGGPAGVAAAAGRVFRDYASHGAARGLGMQHLLFVLALVLLVDTGAVLLRTLAAFAVAHSLTLGAASLGLLSVPAAPVEALIAASAVLVASELVRPPEAPPTLARRSPWMVAFVFGLLHGLGFAAALGAVGLPPERTPLALLAFNLGLEAAQLVFVAAVLVPAWGLVRRLRTHPVLRRVPAYAIGSVAAAWTIERLQALWP